MVLKSYGIYDILFGGQPGFDTYIRSGNDQGITLTKYTSFSAYGSSSTFSIMMNVNDQEIGIKTIINF